MLSKYYNGLFWEALIRRMDCFIKEKLIIFRIPKYVRDLKIKTIYNIMKYCHPKHLFDKHFYAVF